MPDTSYFLNGVQENSQEQEVCHHGLPLDDKIEMTQNQVYGTQNTVAESAARNQPSYQNIDGVQENSQEHTHQEVCQHMDCLQMTR